jgi:hypothetical protein
VPPAPAPTDTIGIATTTGTAMISTGTTIWRGPCESAINCETIN